MMEKRRGKGDTSSSSGASNPSEENSLKSDGNASNPSTTLGKEGLGQQQCIHAEQQTLGDEELVPWGAGALAVALARRVEFAG